MADPAAMFQRRRHLLECGCAVCRRWELGEGWRKSGVEVQSLGGICLRWRLEPSNSSTALAAWKRVPEQGYARGKQAAALCSGVFGTENSGPCLRGRWSLVRAPNGVNPTAQQRSPRHRNTTDPRNQQQGQYQLRRLETRNLERLATGFLTQRPIASFSDHPQPRWRRKQTSATGSSWL